MTSVTMTHRIAAPLALSLAALCVASLCGCAVDTAGESIGASRATVSYSAEEAALILALVNYPGADYALLDEIVGLDKRAASGIVAHRAGSDGVFPSNDDDLVDSLEELDAISYVGASALEKLRVYAVNNPPPHSELVEGVAFAGWEAEAVIWGVNRASVDELDVTVGLDARAAQNLLSAGPYADVSAMGPIGYVGGSALKKLRAYAPIWFAAIQGNSLAGVFDGVYFDQPTAETALEIANTATIFQMMQGGGIYANRAEIIANNRPYVSLSEIADLAGIGKGTIEGLHEFASSNLWPWQGACAASLTPMSHYDVDQYFQTLDGFEPNGYDRYAVTAFAVPSCADMRDPELVDMLHDAIISASGWTNAYNAFPQHFTFGSPVKNTNWFQQLLTGSLAYAERWRDDYLANGDPNAAATYNTLASHKAAIEAIATANPSTTHSIAVHLEALECSQQAVIMIDLTAGIAIVLREGAVC